VSTATTPQMPAVTKLGEAIRLIREDVKIIIGGPHVTLVNAATKSEIKRGVSGGRAAKALHQWRNCFTCSCRQRDQTSFPLMQSFSSPATADTLLISLL